MIRVEYAIFLGCRCAAAFDAGDHDASRLDGWRRDTVVTEFNAFEHQVFSAWAGCHIVVEEIPGASIRTSPVNPSAV